ncbi:hypothetical protein D3C87_1022760 [compost metagenome]
MPEATTTLAIAEAAGAKFGLVGYVVVLVIIGLGTAIYWMLARNQQRMSGADADGQIQALSVYKEMLKAEREARVAAETRADQFARELRDALQQLGELRGQLQAMTAELARVRQELELMRGQIDGNNHG